MTYLLTYLCPGPVPRWGAYSASRDRPTGFVGGSFRGEGEGKGERQAMEGKEKERK